MANFSDEESSILGNILLNIYKDNIPSLNLRGIVGSIGLLPFSNNVIGDTFILSTDQGGYNVLKPLVYHTVLVDNPDYIEPDDNPEFIDATTFVKIGSISDYESINGMTGRKYIEEIPKEDEDSILYNANHSMHAQSSILSNADVGYLFSEYFINEVIESNSRLCPKGVRQGIDLSIEVPDENQVNIFYIPRIDGMELTSAEVNPFISKYNSYFITNNIKTYSGQLAIINVLIELYLDSNTQIMSDLTSIFNQYSNRLTKRSIYTESDMDQTYGDVKLGWEYDYYSQLIDRKQIYSKISKIKYVTSINNFEFLELSYGSDPNAEKVTDLTRIPTSHEKLFIDSDGNQILVRVPIYYRFNLSVNYKNNYEVVS